MRASSFLVAIVAAAAALGTACGGKAKSEDTTAGLSVPEDGAAVPGGDGEELESPEVLEGITTALDRKRAIAARCLSEAVDRGEMPKNSHGKMALAMVITPAGKATGVKVVKSSMPAESIHSCVIEIVEKIVFPQPKKELDWSYTFAFEAM